MAATSSSKQQSVYFLPGFVSGRLNSTEFRRLMKKSGYAEAQNATEADVIIAHSAGCWELPVAPAASCILLIGMPLGNQRLIRKFLAAQKANRRAFIANKRLALGLKILAISIWYGATQPRRNVRIYRANKRPRALPDYPNAQVVFVMPQDDPWPRAPELDEAVRERNWSFVSLPGSHDHIWQDPEAHIAIARSYVN